MNFFKQIFAELRKMLRSKFILISAIVLTLLLTVVSPILNFISEQLMDDYYYYGSGQSVVVGGVEMEGSNSLFWELQNLTQTQEYLSDQLSDATALQYANDLADQLIDFYAGYLELESEEDNYKTQMAYGIASRLTENYILSLEAPDEGALKEAVQAIVYDDYLVTNLFELTEAEQQERVDTNQTILDEYDQLMRTDVFAHYVTIETINLNQQITDNEAEIEKLEQDIIDDPTREEDLSSQIDYLNIRNNTIVEVDIPILEYRAEQNVAINDGSWQDEAISQMQNAQSYLASFETNIITEEKFYEDQWMVDQYSNYQNYLTQQDEDRKDQELELLVAQSSLDSGKPDMTFVDGARKNTQSALSMISLVSVFAILVGGLSIATEFQSGTVRLLMIRPRTRLKVFFSRFTAGLLLSYAVFLVIMIITAIVNGFRFGFEDYFYPNYTGSGEVNFALMLLGQGLVTSMSMFFLYCLSYAVSTFFRNVAVAMILPTVLLFGATIALAFLTQADDPLQFISFTPLPYLTMSDFWSEWSMASQLIEQGYMLSEGLGVAMLLVYSAILMVFGTIFFKRHDITN